ncbi:MAG: LysM peptidoglycan-binding domain-containing protein [Pseudomonadota bacterium]
MRNGLIACLIMLAGFVLDLPQPGAPAQAQQRLACGQDYTVQRGETLSIIARRAYGPNQFRRLHRVNIDRMGADPNLLEVGTVLRIPCDLSAPVTPDPPAPEAEENTAVLAPAAQAPDPDALTGGPLNRVEVVFNKAAAPQFILNAAIIDPFLADIERATAGRVRFVEPASPERDPQKQLDLVKSGAADAAYIFNGHLVDSHPLVQITMQPMIGGSALETATALWRVHDRFFRPADNFEGLTLLGFVGAPPAHLWRTAEAEGGAGDNWAIPYFDGLDKGAAGTVPATAQDGSVFAMAHSTARALGVWNKAVGVTEIDGGVYAPTFSVFISEEKWSEISGPDQAAILRLSGEALASRSAAWDSFDLRQRSEMIAQGLTVIQPDLDLQVELQDRSRLSWEQWIAKANAEGISGFDAINAFFREMDALRKQFRG